MSEYTKTAPLSVTNAHDKRKKQRGFTLIELLVVLIILGGIAAIVTPQVFKYLDGSKVDTAQLQIDRLSGVLDLYRLDTGRYPNAQEGLNALVTTPSEAKNWNGPYIKKENALIDPWGQAYQYKVPGEHGDYDLYSFGADGREGGEDTDSDIVSW
ncbi:type II secretion system major pseudopilin GspG [Kiloniella majae]|uniref:type II secretion system major pseudopilin GspG n=1 Tax=Kiloniella majae TaxID=1938558 RepID=UPI000A2783EB|nr:type II secretion system major pseudopilin GspG [Kiloniella majae]